MNEGRLQGLCTSCSLCQKYLPPPHNIYETGPNTSFRSSRNLQRPQPFTVALLSFILCLQFPNHAQELSCVCICLFCLFQPHRCETVSSWTRSYLLYWLLVLCLFAPFHPPPTILRPALGSGLPCWIAYQHSSSPSGFWLCFDQWETLAGDWKQKGHGTLGCHLDSRRSPQAGFISRSVVLNWG